MNEKLEKYRVKFDKLWGTDPGDDKGLFFIPTKASSLSGPKLKVLSSPFKKSEGWQHVSVSLPNRCPTWAEMDRVKELFWGEDETVVQFHPKKSEYVNNHPNCLHLWKKIGTEHELPPSILTGIK
jgi:hypothetical protein